MSDDHYAILGVPPDADYTAIRAAYLQQMRAMHPDRRPGDPTAAEAARRLNNAFRVLKDHGTRADYDRARSVAARRGTAASVNGSRPTKARPTGRHDLSIQEKASVRGAQEAQEHYRRFQMWCVRVSLGLVAAGLVLLLLVGG